MGTFLGGTSRRERDAEGNDGVEYRDVPIRLGSLGVRLVAQ